MTNLDELLASALSRYRVLLQAYKEFGQSALGSDGKRLEQLVEQITQKMVAAREVDQVLRACLDEVALSDRLLPMLLEYRDLLADAAECNQQLLEQARTHRALVSAELSELRDGKMALAGYRISSGNNGQTLSKAY